MPYLTRAQPREQTIVNFASLGILVPLLDKLNIANIIDRRLPTDPQAEFSHGTVLNVLLAARLNHPTALVNVAAWAAKHGLEYLCNIPADKLNDDRIGRSLDALFEQRHAILAEVTCWKRPTPARRPKAFAGRSRGSWARKALPTFSAGSWCR